MESWKGALMSIDTEYRYRFGVLVQTPFKRSRIYYYPKNSPGHWAVQVTAKGSAGYKQGVDEEAVEYFASQEVAWRFSKGELDAELAHSEDLRIALEKEKIK
jgi:hypothetical protein